MKKKINGKMMAGYLILGGMALALVVLMAAGRQKKTRNFDVHLTQEENSLYTSKLEALRAKAKGNAKPARGYGEALQSPDRNPSPLTTQIEDDTEVAPSSAKSANAVPRSEDLIRAQQQAQRIVSKHTHQDISNDEYLKLEQDIKSVYEDEPKASAKESSVPKMSDKERRKAMMEQSWDEVGSEQNAVADPSRNFTGVIHKTQTVKNGSVALLRTTQPIKTGNWVIPANTLLSGEVSIGRERLNIAINSVRVDKQIIPLHLAVYGTDGIAGIPVKTDAVGHELNDEVTDEAVHQVGNAVSRTGSIGRAIGSIFSGTARAVKREKEREVVLIDNQMIIFRIN